MISKLTPNFFFALIISCSYMLTAVQADEETPLGETMGDMNVYFKKMRKTDDAKEGVELARKAQATCLKSLEYIPAMTEKVDNAEQKAKDIADYNRLVGLTYVGFCRIEMAFLNSDLEEAADIIDELRKLKKEGHEKYIEE